MSRKSLLLVVLVLSLLIPVAADAEDGIANEPTTTYYRGVVREVGATLTEDLGYGMILYKQRIKVELLEGPFKGEIVTAEHHRGGRNAFDFQVRLRDRVLLLVELEDGAISQAYIESIARDHLLLGLSIVFVLLLVAVGQVKGVKAALTLGLTILAVVKVLLPQMLLGRNPLWLAVAVAASVTAFTLTVVSGFNRKTLTAIVGTTAGVVIAGFIAMKIGTIAALTGLSGEEAQMLLFIPQEVEFDFRGLLFAGMIIGALGAVMDVGMSISSAMEEVRRARPGISRGGLRQAGMNVGKDVMGTMSNTLILAYTGGAIPLLLLFLAYDIPLVRILNMDLVATEVVRSLAGSIGLILTIPITALVGSYLLQPEGARARETGQAGR
ncbi:MAG: YibE/F family protein [Bacillota bacterium]